MPYISVMNMNESQDFFTFNIKTVNLHVDDLLQLINNEPKHYSKAIFILSDSQIISLAHDIFDRGYSYELLTSNHIRLTLNTINGKTNVIATKQKT